MSLWDVDKNGDTRTNPKLNVRNVQYNRQQNNTLGTTYRTDSTFTYQRVIFKNGLIISYDDQNRVIKIDGFEPRVANYPIVIQAKYGFDVYADILGLTPPAV